MTGIVWRLLLVLVAVVLPMIAQQPSWAGTRLSMAIVETEYEAYLATLKYAGMSPLDIASLKGTPADRGTAEVVMALQALSAGGFEVVPEFVVVPNTARSRALLANGIVAFSPTTFFSKALSSDVLASSPVVPARGFVKGLYGLKANKLLMGVKTLDDLAQLRAVSTKAWVIDWATLEEARPGRIWNVPNDKLMFKMVGEGKADFLLHEFPFGEDLSLTNEGITLYPAPGVKIGLDDSRRFAVSREHPLGHILLEALEKGLAVLREQGTIDQFYRDVGFYNPNVADWKLLNDQK